MKPYRAEKIASEIREVVGGAIVKHLADPRISHFASVTRVTVSADLAYADVYVSIMGSDAEQRRSLTGLRHARGHLQGLVARRLRIRQCPEVRLHLDESIKRSAEIVRIIDETMGRHPEPGPGPDDPAVAAGGDDA